MILLERHRDNPNERGIQRDYNKLYLNPDNIAAMYASNNKSSDGSAALGSKILLTNGVSFTVAEKVTEIARRVAKFYAEA
jgi:hypothetical protein